MVRVDVLARPQDDLGNVGQVGTPRLLVDGALVHAGVLCAAGAVDGCDVDDWHLLKQHLGWGKNRMIYLC